MKTHMQDWPHQACSITACSSCFRMRYVARTTHLIQRMAAGVICQAKAQKHNSRLLQVARNPVQARQGVAHAACKLRTVPHPVNHRPAIGHT